VTTRKSKNPAFPDAHPTAPGGMSEKQLIAELVTRFDWDETEAKALSWPEKIDAVAQARRAAEVAQSIADRHGADVFSREEPLDINDPDAVDRLIGEMSLSRGEVEEMMHDRGIEVTDDDDDIDALLADLEEMTADTEPLCGCGLVESAHPKPAGHAFQDASLYPDDIQIVLSAGVIDLAAEFDAMSDEVKSKPQFTEALFIGLPGTRDYIFDGHRGTGPSAAERWMECTASLGASRAFLETLTPNQQVEYATGSQAARQGTTAHSVAEVQARVLLGEITPEEADLALMELAVHPPDGEDYDEEMETHVSEYVALVAQYVDEQRDVRIESRVTATIPLLSVTNGEEDTYDLTGSLDLGVMPVPEAPVLVVGDLKYGEGVDVSVEANPQVRIYALGLLAEVVEMYDGLPEWLEWVEYVIVQPRLGGIKVWREKVDDLLDWQENVLSVKLTEALGGAKAGAAFSPGDSTCQWCPARGGCPALLAHRQEAAAELFDVMIEMGGDEFPETITLTNDELARYYTQIRGLVKLHDEIKAELQRRAYRGDAIPGYGLVNYQPPRHWTEEAAEELDPSNKDHGILTEEQAAQLWQRSLLSPTQAEKVLGEAFARVERLVVKPDKRPVIAPEGDRRSKWQGKAPEDMFDIEED